MSQVVGISIKDLTPTPMIMDEDGEFRCPHTEAYIEKACCSGIDSEGNVSCGCHGQDGVLCPAIDCTGIQDHEVDELFDRLIGDREEDLT